jgi:hypothetical protein
MKTQLVVLGCLELSACLAHVTVQAAPAKTAEWIATTWKGEHAFELVTTGWRAIVSVERGRLVHFGPAGAGNLLFETDSRENKFSWGGHRVWLGPQSLWGWPPPDAWERAAAEKATVVGGRLELLVPDAGRGYPRMTRVYELAADRLACRIVVAAGGTRSVQVMQILQTSLDTTVDLQPGPSAKAPRGYFRVGGSSGPTMRPDLPRPVVVQELSDGRVRVGATGKTDKLGFPPQTLVANIGAHRLRLAFGESRGPEVAAPDGGFYTQVYTGDSGSPVVELEQLSPQWLAGEAGEFSMYIGLTEAR